MQDPYLTAEVLSAHNHATVPALDKCWRRRWLPGKRATLSGRRGRQRNAVARWFRPWSLAVLPSRNKTPTGITPQA